MAYCTQHGTECYKKIPTLPIFPYYPQFPLDTSLLRYVSATPAELIRLTLVYVSIPTRSAALRICSIPAPAVVSDHVIIAGTPLPHDAS